MCTHNRKLPSVLAGPSSVRLHGDGLFYFQFTPPAWVTYLVRLSTVSSRLSSFPSFSSCSSKMVALSRLGSKWPKFRGSSIRFSLTNHHPSQGSVMRAFHTQSRRTLVDLHSASVSNLSTSPANESANFIIRSVILRLCSSDLSVFHACSPPCP